MCRQYCCWEVTGGCHPHAGDRPAFVACSSLVTEIFGPVKILVQGTKIPGKFGPPDYYFQKILGCSLQYSLLIAYVIPSR